MVCISKVEYYGRVFIIIGVDIGRLLLRVCVIVPTSIIVIIIVVISVLIFSRNLFLIVLVVV